MHLIINKPELIKLVQVVKQNQIKGGKNNHLNNTFLILQVKDGQAFIKFLSKQNGETVVKSTTCQAQTSQGDFVTGLNLHYFLGLVELSTKAKTKEFVSLAIEANFDKVEIRNGFSRFTFPNLFHSKETFLLDDNFYNFFDALQEFPEMEIKDDELKKTKFVYNFSEFETLKNQNNPTKFEIAFILAEMEIYKTVDLAMMEKISVLKNKLIKLNEQRLTQKGNTWTPIQEEIQNLQNTLDKKTFDEMKAKIQAIQNESDKWLVFQDLPKYQAILREYNPELKNQVKLTEQVKNIECILEQNEKPKNQIITRTENQIVVLGIPEPEPITTPKPSQSKPKPKPTRLDNITFDKLPDKLPRTEDQRIIEIKPVQSQTIAFLFNNLFFLNNTFLEIQTRDKAKTLQHFKTKLPTYFSLFLVLFLSFRFSFFDLISLII
jgi:hypothetical protein